jgi:16S rRNA (guanine527-N7)-methyltransferase
MTDALKQTLTQGLAALGLSPTQEGVDKLGRYCDLLLEKNQVMNLTAITDPAEVVQLHFLDSAALLPSKALHGKKIIDVGTGGGFPGLVLKILDPTIQLTLLDSLGKRVDWLSEVCQDLGLTDVVCQKGRAEELGLDKAYRDQYDVAVSRALASMPVLAELCLPFVKPGGLFMAMKSNKTDEEIESAETIIAKLGGEPPFVMDYRLPESEVYHRVVTVMKAKATPSGYPRRWAKIKESKN